jgi:hypothetical protein
MYIPQEIKPQAGVQRDGTTFDSENFIDAKWTRFYRDRPKKMGGYNSIINSLPEIVRGISSYTAQNTTYAHLGSAVYVLQTLINSSGSFSGLNDRTPAGLVSSANRLWQFEVFYDSAGGTNYLIAHGPDNLNDISNESVSPIYSGAIKASTVLVDTAVTGESGGIAAVAPYLFKFGTDGHIAWCVPNDPTDFVGVGSGEAWVTPAKIIKGMPLRGGGNGPAAIFWSLDSLIRGNFVGTAAGIWAFDTLASDISVLSSQGIIEYDGTYYWAAVDRFMKFNGVVQEVENNMNLDWFFGNLNQAQRQKVFTFKVPRYGEIWWCFPYGNATECTHAVIYNVRKNIWYDTILPEGGRSAGIFAKVYNRPFMTGVVDDSGFQFWQHETGVNKIDGADVQPVQAWFQTNEFCMMQSGEPSNKALSIAKIEPDFVQVKNMRLVVKGRANAKATEIDSADYVIYADPADSYQQQVPLKETRRLLSLYFESNDVDGDFYMGHSLMHLEPTDARELQ